MSTVTTKKDLKTKLYKYLEYMVHIKNKIPYLSDDDITSQIGVINNIIGSIGIVDADIPVLYNSLQRELREDLFFVFNKLDEIQSLFNEGKQRFDDNKVLNYLKMFDSVSLNEAINNRFINKLSDQDRLQMQNISVYYNINLNYEGDLHSIEYTNLINNFYLESAINKINEIKVSFKTFQFNGLIPQNLNLQRGNHRNLDIYMDGL